MNIQEKIDEIVNKVLSEELGNKINNVKTKINEAETQEIDEMEEYYEIAKERKEARMASRKGKNNLIGVYSDNSTEDGLDPQLGEEEVEESNAFVLAADAAKDAGKDEFEFPEGSGEMHKVTIKTDIKTESKKTSLQLTEDEMIELIERIVIQEKSAVESLEKKNSKETKKSNDDYIKDVTKKMKSYMKDMGISYDGESDEFPRGNTMMDITDKNGKVKNSDKKQMYQASDAVDEYIDQVARAGGMENLDYDQIKPDEDRMEKYIMGSSETGNSDEYANAVKTDVNKDVNKRRKLNVLAKLKKMSYQKADQPVYDVAGNEKHSDEMKFLQVASIDEKKKDKINEDLDKMKNLIDYNKKTQ